MRIHRRHAWLALSGLVTVAWVGTPLGQGRGQTPVPAPRPGAPASAQPGAQAPAPRGTGVILGQVLDAESGRPMAGAVVSLGGGTTPAAAGLTGGGVGFAGSGPGAANTQRPPASPRRVLTDSQGRFMFYALPPGSYTASAAAPGYMSGAAGQTQPNGPSRGIVLKDDQKTGNVAISLWKFGVITGTVVDETGDPAVNAPVQVLMRQGTGRFMTSAMNRTDDRGVYRISGLSPGNYIVAVPSTNTTMPTSVINAYQQLMSAQDRSAANALQGRLDTSGAPPPFANGQRIGDAYLQQASPFGPSGLLPMKASDPDKVFVYQTQFFPAATTSAQATPIALRAGDERTSVDFQLRPVQSFKVSGVVVASDGPAASLGVKLLPANFDEFSFDNGLEVATTATEADGKFTFLGVPAGSYSIKVLRVPRPVAATISTSFAAANGGGFVNYSFTGGSPGVVPTPPTEPTLWAELPVSVGDADVTGVMLPLRIGPRVSGRVEFDGTTPKPALTRVPPVVSVNLNPVGGRSTGPITQPVVGANGQFSSMSLPPGKYMVTGGAPGWILLSAMLGGVDVSEVPLALDSSDLSGLVVTFFDRPAQITGVVRNARGEPADSVTIIMMPTDFRAQSGAGFTSRRLRVSRSATDGKYSLASVLPGEYLIAALTENIVASAVDPIKVFDAISGVATRVTIGDSEKRTQELTVSQIQIR